jgi:hypothetical protein
MDASLTLRIVATLLALLASPSLRAAAQTPQAGPNTQAPRFSLAIDLLQDAIRDDAELPVEITMTNTSGMEFAYGSRALGPPLWTDFCQLDVRDSGGKQLEERCSIYQFLGGTEGMPKAVMLGGPLLILGPGEKVHVEVLLNRVFDLSKPGKYTIQALWSDNGFTVKSNILRANVKVAESKARKAKPRFSMTLSSPYPEVKAGYQVPVKVAVTNLSRKRTALRTWQEDNHIGAGIGHEFASGIAVRDAMGNPAPKTKEGQDLDRGTTFPAGSFRVVWLEPGETYEETKIVGKLYDLSRPGRYEFQVALFDPKTNVAARSNPVTVNVLGTDGDPQSGKQPPFLLDIRTPADSVRKYFGFKAAAYLAITNRSNHAIDFDIGYGDNDVDVYGRDGNLAPLTETGRRYRGPLPRGGPPTQHLQPGETKSGGMINLDSLYDLSLPGLYTVQVRAFDGESKSIVESNRITITVD